MSTDASAPLLHTAEQAAARLGGAVSAYWLMQQARLEAIPCTRLGRKVRWSERDLADMVALLRCEPKNRVRSH